MRQVQATIDRIGLLQIDSVNVLARAHLLPLYSRLGPYDVGLLEKASSKRPRRLVEYWAHEASFVPPETHRLLRWRMDRADREAWRTVRAAADQPELLEDVVAEVERSGPVTAGQVAAAVDPDHIPDKSNWGWNWPPVKSALEYLFWSGRITSAGRTGQFERLYDLPERVIPGHVHEAAAPSQDEAIEGLLEISARAHGVGTARCLRDYFRLPARESKEALERLAADGRLIEAEVEGFSAPAWLHPEARRPRRVNARALLAPFDPLIFERRRLEELFDFHYRIEIYTPKAKRRHGYYVLPLLLNEEIVGRVDLKSDRDGSTLLVQSAWVEPEAPVNTAEELAGELRLMSGWLGLDEVEVRPHGDLADDLKATL
ncbi:MAG: YcaQ family DNA glycosylase [Solirubrobacterales bacterium]|nr:YcaQ family DNA glycosylase [Solirubrobacterales bacterium]MCB0861338.1 YcaQ family DNA glycosylase [Solirubrobacterales bacterium]